MEMSALGLQMTAKKQDFASSESESDYDDYKEDEDDEYESVKVKGLFSDEFFNNIQDMFKHELKMNKFNLIDVVKRYNMEMIDYIKMINFIREKVLIYSTKSSFIKVIFIYCST
jgi:hypothetical protein